LCNVHEKKKKGKNLMKKRGCLLEATKEAIYNGKTG